MNERELNERLSQITTRWSDLRAAHAKRTSSAQAVRESLLGDYLGAVYRYLLASVRDADVAQDLAHEFVLRFLRGDFGKARPQRGRFRDYLKAAVANLLHDHFRKRRDQPGPLPLDLAAHGEKAADAEGTEADFALCWRKDVLERAWKSLRQLNRSYYEVLRIKADYTEALAPEIAERLSNRLGKQMAHATVRKTLQRARARFADLLIDEVAKSLETPDADALEAELKELDLFRYCSAALDRKKRMT